MSRPIVVTVCMDSSSESWEPYQPPLPWHSRAGGGAVHSITSGCGCSGAWFADEKFEFFPQSKFAGSLPHYLKPEDTDVNVEFRLDPIENTAVAIAIDRAPAIKAYSIAVAPLRSATKNSNKCFTAGPFVSPSQLGRSAPAIRL